MGKLENKISRTLSLALRHDPTSLGLTLDPAGWADVDELLTAFQKKHKGFDRPLLEKIVQDSAQKRFAFSEESSRIRAIEGHSFDIALQSVEKKPPEFLYHGTAALHMDEIEISGLLKGKRQHVHLYEDSRDAHDNAQRHGKNIILEVAAHLMVSHDFKFHLAENGVWLTETVPPDYLNRRFVIS